MRSYLSLNPLAKAKFGTGSTVRALDDAATLIGGLDDTTPTWLGLTLSGKAQKKCCEKVQFIPITNKYHYFSIGCHFSIFFVVTIDQVE